MLYVEQYLSLTQPDTAPYVSFNKLFPSSSCLGRILDLLLHAFALIKFFYEAT